MAKEYIEREAIAKKAINMHGFGGAKYVPLSAIMNHPTADVVEVVRCKDCKHFGGHGVCHCHAADENGTPIFVRANDFCSYGEKRDNNGNEETL